VYALAICCLRDNFRRALVLLAELPNPTRPVHQDADARTLTANEIVMALDRLMASGA
jgi:hypothetical protein